MSGNISDLGVLSRAGPPGPPPGRQVGPAAAANVPPPKVNWKTRVLLPAALLLSAGGLLAYAARDALRPATPVRVVPVVVRTVQADASPGESAPQSAATVQAPGWVEPDPFPVAVSALTDGVVRDVPVLEGEAVKAGQIVARMVEDDAELALRKAEADLAVRQGELAVAKATLDAAQRDWDHPVERVRQVAAAEAMAAEARAELERLPVEVAAERARAEELADALRRAETNVARQTVGEVELVQARLRLKAQESTVAAAEARRPMLAAKVRQQQAELTAAKEAAKLRVAERRALDEAAADVGRAEAAVRQAAAARDEAKLRRERTEVKSPADGVVMARLVAPGSKLMLAGDNMQSAQVLRLYDPKKLQVRVDVPLADAAQVGVGQAAKVVVGVLPDRTFDGVVTRVVHEADIQRNTVQVKVAIKDPSPELKPEMLARVRFLAPVRGAGTAGAASGGGGTSQRVFAPQGLLRRQGESARATAWVVDKGRGVATRRQVTLGNDRHGDWIAVASGLQPGDVLVAGDTSRLDEGERVEITGEADAPAGAPAAGGESHGAD